MIPIHLNRKKLDRRKFLACITTIGTGVVIGGADVKASELKKIDPISNKILMTNSMLSQNAPNLYKSIDFRYFVAGGGCAAFSHAIATPVDVVKTKMQAEPEIFNSGVIDAVSLILERDGRKMLLKGLGPTIVGYGLEGGLKFGIYEAMKPNFVNMLASVTDSNTVPFLAASVVAGGIASIVLCPMESTRIKLVTTKNFADGFVDGFTKLLKEGGVSFLFSGFLAMISKQIPYTMMKQVSFDVFASLFYTAASNTMLGPDIKLGITIMSAFLASLLACLASNPGDVILTKTYNGNYDSDRFVDVVKNIFEDDGFKGFFYGLDARLIHVGIIVTSQLIVYDFFKQLLGLPATGS